MTQLITPKIVFVIVLLRFCEGLEFDFTIEEGFISKIRGFLESERRILTELQEFKSSIEKIHNKVANDENYLKNPINDYLIVKRLVMDWQLIAAVASLNKHKFLNELHENSSNILKHDSFPSLSNLKDSVVKIAHAQAMHGIKSASEFVMTLTNDPYTKLTASEYAVFAKVLRTVNKDVLAEQWEMESKASQALSEDPLMEIQDFPSLLQQLYAVKA